LLTYLVGADKEYTATIRLGVATTTDDADGETTAAADASAVTRAAIDVGVAALTGSIQQVPSSVSAIKVDGKRAYALVRAGQSVELPPRSLTIHRFDVHEVRAATADGVAVVDVDVSVECSSGTYVRALARDLGAGLGVGGHLTALRRTRVGGYRLGAARTLDELAALADDGPLPVLSLAAAARASFPARELTGEEAVALSHGKRIAAASTAPVLRPREPLSAAPTGRPTAGFAPDGTLVALLDDRAVHSVPVVVFAPA
jgi:tRNA pseudouridine55 synthase